jgi:NAD(P)-dependent dehydrogenase (short-subunit alcohol dehydrogenase family)
MQLDSQLSAIVTGGASGLGAATARHLARSGVRVALFDLNTQAGETLASEIGGVFVRVDVTSDADVAAGFAAARAAHGQERLLVNCAGISIQRKTASRDRSSGAIRGFEANAFGKVIEVNLMGTFRCLAAAATGMLALEPLPSGERGLIVNTSSVAAQDGQIGQAAYSASKAAIAGMTLPIARDLMGEGIRVNTILPGIFETPLMMAVPDAVRDNLVASIPFPNRFGRPDEYAALVASIAAIEYLNGECIRLDAAIRMAPR